MCIVYIHAYCICVYIFKMCVCFFYFTSSTYSITVLPARMSPHEKRLWYFRALILRERIQWDRVLIVQTIALVMEKQHLQDIEKENLPMYTDTV